MLALKASTRGVGFVVMLGRVSLRSGAEVASKVSAGGAEERK